SGVSIALASTFASPVALRVLEHGTVGTLGFVLVVAIGLPGLVGYLMMKRELARDAATLVHAVIQRRSSSRTGLARAKSVGWQVAAGSGEEFRTTAPEPPLP
ncbi:hypothetical protein, partial [Mycobacterium sp. ACS4331]|uniref:hypothetical protein n=1 Tax=Mycobacterium sp. ACS4331 TaxID=1834121 RepID=UPI000A441A67